MNTCKNLTQNLCGHITQYIVLYTVHNTMYNNTASEIQTEFVLTTAISIFLFKLFFKITERNLMLPSWVNHINKAFPTQW